MRRKVRIAAAAVAVGCVLVLYGLFVAHRDAARVDDTRVRPGGPGVPLIVHAGTRSASLSGHVWTKGHQPVTGARVCAVRASSDPTAIDAHSCTSSGADGAFRVSGLRAESYRVMASADGFVPALAAQTEGLFLRLGSDYGGVDIYLDHDGVELSGQVLDATGGPVPGAKVRIVHWQTPPLVAFVETDHAGHFVSWTPAGDVTLTASADGYASSRPLLRVAPTRNVELTLIPGASVRGFVLTAQGERPVVGAEISATPLNSPIRAAETTSRADGSFELSGLEPSNYALYASAPGFSSRALKVVSVGLGELVPDVIIAMTPGAQVDGTVLSGQGETPCTQGIVTLGPRPRGYSQRAATSWPSDRTRDATTSLRATIESDGHVHFDAVPAARYFAQVACASSRPQGGPQVVEVGDANVEGLVFRVEPSPTLTIRAVDEAGQPAVGAQLVFEWPARDGAPGLRLPLTVDSRGEFAWTSGLWDGVYKLKPFPPYEGEPVAFEIVGQAGHVEAVIKLRGSGAIAVTAHDTDGEPIDDLTVAVQGATASAPEGAHPTESVAVFAAAPRGLGVYRAGPLPPGRYRVEVTDGVNPPIERGAAAGAEPAVEVVAGRQSELSITVARAAQIRGTVVDAAGAPVSNVWVSVANEAAMAKLPPGYRQLLGPSRRSLTEPDGTFVLGGLDPNASYSVRAEEPDGSSVKVQRSVVAGTKITITLPNSSRLAGTVSDEQGRPLDSFVIELTPSELDSPRVMQFSRTNGRFSIDRVPPGKVSVLASGGAGLRAHSEIDLSGGTAREDLRLTLRPLAALDPTPNLTDRSGEEATSAERGL